MIKSIDEFYVALESLNKPIISYCPNCKRHCCRGYIVLFEDEAERLVKQNVSVLESRGEKDSCYLLDTYPRDESGKLKRGVCAPLCPNRLSASECSIYQHRPLVCRLYPIDIQEIQGSKDPNWVVHKKCDFISESSEHDISSWLKNVELVVSDIEKELLLKIEIEWRKLVNGMIYPPDFEGYDLYKLKEFYQ